MRLRLSLDTAPKLTGQLPRLSTEEKTHVFRQAEGSVTQAMLSVNGAVEVQVELDGIVFVRPEGLAEHFARPLFASHSAPEHRHETIRTPPV